MYAQRVTHRNANRTTLDVASSRTPMIASNSRLKNHKVTLDTNTAYYSWKRFSIRPIDKERLFESTAGIPRKIFLHIYSRSPLLLTHIDYEQLRWYARGDNARSCPMPSNWVYILF